MLIVIFGFIKSKGNEHFIGLSAVSGFFLEL